MPRMRYVVLQLRQLDLELAFGGVRMLGEDVENHGGAIDHAHLEPIFEMALLSRACVRRHTRSPQPHAARRTA